MSAEIYLNESGNWRSFLNGGLITPGAGAPTFAGDPGDGNFYVSWADGPGGSGDISVGNSWSLNKISVFHNYSTAANGQPSTAMIDEAIGHNVIASQSFKLNGTNTTGILAGDTDAQITAAAQACIAREPWPIWLCYFHEPAGNFTTDTARANYRAAYRYIVQRFRAEGAGSNINWMPIQEAPWDFRPTAINPTPSGGGRNVDWRKYHPDWNGGTTGTRADWYDDLVCDTIGLDIYNPLVGGTGFQDYDEIWDDVEWQWEQGAFPVDEYGGVCIMEMGWSDVIDPDPDWNAYAARTLARQQMHNIKCFTWWNNNNDTPRRYDFTAASDADGDKLSGWQSLCSAATVWSPS